MPGEQPRLARRAQDNVAHGKDSPFMSILFRAFENQYSASNPDGVIIAGLAENSLMRPWLKAFYEKHIDLQPDDFTYGTSVAGSERLFAALARFYDHYIHPCKPLKRKHIIAMNGATAVLEQLAFVLGDVGDAFVVPAPRYNAIPEDFQTKAQVRCIEPTVSLKEAGTSDEVKKVEEAIVRDGRVRAILLINPHNPLGFCYSRSVLLEYARLAEKHNMFLIVDEIYATSIYTSDRPMTPFTSILSLDVQKEAGCSPSRILQIYGASKDFGSNGLRLGVLVVQDNADFYGGMMAMAPFVVKISSPADAMWSALLASDELPTYVKKNQEALAAGYAHVTSWLKQRDIPYIPANAGHFVLIDLGAYCSSEDGSSADATAEIRLAERMVEAGVYIGPGFSYAVHEPGWFRLTFSIEHRLLDLALDRIDKALKGVDGAGKNGSAQVNVDGLATGVKNM